MVCFNLKDGANISDYDVYRVYSMHGGLGFSEYKLKTILEPYFDIVEFREMVESTDGNAFGKSFMWTVLMQKNYCYIQINYFVILKSYTRGQ